MRNEITIKISSRTLSEEELNLIMVNMSDILKYAESFLSSQMTNGNRDNEKCYNLLCKLNQDETHMLEGTTTTVVHERTPDEIKNDIDHILQNLPLFHETLIGIKRDLEENSKEEDD